MGLRRHAWLGLAFSFLASTVWAEDVPTFRDHPLKFDIAAGQRSEVSLPSLLKTPGIRKRIWNKFGNSMPTWITIDAANEKLILEPPASASGFFDGTVAGKLFGLNAQQEGPTPGNPDNGDISQMQVTVRTVPNWKITELNLGKLPEEKTLTVNINDPNIVEDPSGNPLEFSLEDSAGVARWLSVSLNGELTGTPHRADVGPFRGLFIVAKTNTGGTRKVPVVGEVVRVFKCPTWAGNPLTLPDATEDTQYGENVAQAKYLTYTEPEALTFSVTGGTLKDWLSFNGSTLGGMPRRPGGAVSVNVRASVTSNEGTVCNADTVLKFQLRQIQKPPAWSQNPIVLPDGFKRTAYTPVDLKTFITDPDGDALTFKFVNAPTDTWAQVSNAGVFSGTPKPTDVRLHEWTVEATDGNFPVQTKVQVTVKNRPPVCANPATLTEALQERDYSFDLTRLVTDADQDPLTFAPVLVPAWLQTTADGKLTGKPAESDVGAYQGKWNVTDSDGATCQLVANGSVKRTNWPPQIVKDPIEITVKERELKNLNLNDPQFVQDADNTDTLRFALTTTPAPGWATIAPAGMLALAPQHAQLAGSPFTFTYTVTDGKVPKPVAGTIKVTVVRDPRPPVWKRDPIVFNVVAGQDLNENIRGEVSDLDGMALTLRATGVPAWLTFDPGNGDLKGRPAETDVGSPSFKVFAANDALESQVTVIVNVKSSNRPPVWKEPVVLPDGMVDESYAESLAAFASDPDPGDTLTFELRTTNTWVFVTSAGLVIGDPKIANVGVNRIPVRVKDRRGDFADTTMQITIKQKTPPPSWTRDPIDLGSAMIGKDFSFNLAPLVTVPSGKPVTFRYGRGITPPPWLQLSAAGRLTGIPQPTDLGAYTTVFEVSEDGVVWVPVNAFGRVIKANEAPTIKPIKLIVKARETKTEDLKPYVTDPENDQLTFELPPGGPTWARITPQGLLTLTPQDPDIGNHSIALRVRDSAGNTTNGTIEVEVIEGGKPPTWKQKTIVFTAVENRLFTAALVGYVDNPDGLPLTFSKVTGKAWLDVQPDGTLRGTPASADLGDNTFGVLVKNRVGEDSATVIVKVVPEAPQEEDIRIDEPVPGARVDNVWIVDNTRDPCAGESCFIADLKLSIGEYYRELDSAGVHHLGVYLASDACRYRQPISDFSGEVLLKWDNSNWERSFHERIQRSPGRREFNSSLVAIWQLLAKTIATVPSPFFEEKVPMEMLMLSNNGDYFKSYSHWPEVASMTPADYASYYLQEHAKAKKPMRVSALGSSASPSFQTVVNQTKGKHYAYSSGTMASSLRDYAKQVIFRAQVLGKRKIKLSKQPADPTAIEIMLAGQPLARDKWQYLQATNEIEIFWDKIDVDTLKPGDRLVIKYRAATVVATRS